MDEYMERAAVVKMFQGDSQNKYYQFEVVNRLRDIPAADVKPVVRGRWVYHPEAEWKYECNRCGSYVPGEWNYCPECGSYNGGDISVDE